MAHGHEYEKIVVLGQEFDCQKSYGYEYHDQESLSGYPFKPYLYEAIIDGDDGDDGEGGTKAYLLDAKGIFWILENVSYDGETFLKFFNRPCCRYCKHYIGIHDKEGYLKVDSLHIDFITNKEIEKGEWVQC